MEKISKREKEIFWDYDLQKIDLRDPETKKWYLRRKLGFGDFSNVRERDLKKYLPELQIDPSLKQLLSKYFKSDASI